MTNEAIRAQLEALRDADYAVFQAKLIPNVAPEKFIGVRTPQLRALAKSLVKAGGYDGFLSALPHTFFDENQLHAFLLSELRDFGTCLDGVERFLPYVDNWATCDQLSPRVFARQAEALLPSIRGWLASEHVYTVRFGIGMLMQHFLDSRFDPTYPELVASVRSEEYYVNMMIAWYFATALTKQYDAALPYLTEKQLSAWVHNKTIQKACESFRVPPERKEFLKSLKRKNERQP